RCTCTDGLNGYLAFCAQAVKYLLSSLRSHDRKDARITHQSSEMSRADSSKGLSASVGGIDLGLKNKSGKLFARPRHLVLYNIAPNGGYPDDGQQQHDGCDHGHFHQ